MIKLFKKIGELYWNIIKSMSDTLLEILDLDSMLGAVQLYLISAVIPALCSVLLVFFAIVLFDISAIIAIPKVWLYFYILGDLGEGIFAYNIHLGLLFLVYIFLRFSK